MNSVAGVVVSTPPPVRHHWVGRARRTHGLRACLIRVILSCFARRADHTEWFPQSAYSLAEILESTSRSSNG